MTDYTSLVNQAAAALLTRSNVAITHPPGWVRDGFPLPVQRNKPDVLGSVTQDYRPMALFEYVNDKLNAEAAGERIAEVHATKKADAPADLFGGMQFDVNAPVGDCRLVPASNLFG